MSLGQRNLLLLLLVLLLAGVPAAIALGWLPSPMGQAEWAGGDSIIQDRVTELHGGDYKPWFESIFRPDELGIERYMFGLQALIGAGLVAGFLGWMVGRRHALTGHEGGERRVATIVSAVCIVIALALLFVQTDLGELQAFITALQGVCLATLAFFIGYPMGRKAGATTMARPSSAAPTLRTTR